MIPPQSVLSQSMTAHFREERRVATMVRAACEATSNRNPRYTAGVKQPFSGVERPTHAKIPLQSFAVDQDDSRNLRESSRQRRARGEEVVDSALQISSVGFRNRGKREVPTSRVDFRDSMKPRTA